ncbi:MAG: polymer-forming cytoskeletal protein [Eubacteriales bacterium]|nr:polymer-forming cytoskeletal protein [Eubacteriales bacterium]
MGIRDNFRQAIDEMIGTKPAETTAPDDRVENSNDFSSQEQVAVEFAPDEARTLTSEPGKKGPGTAAVKSLSNLAVRPGQNAGAKTIITIGTVVKGDLASQSDLDIQGTIVGNVKSEGLIRITGKVEGDIACENLELDNADIKGQISVNKHLVMRGETMVVGNLLGEQMEINGKIKGNISVNATLHLLSKSSVLGDIHASTIQIDAGAKVFGHLNITSSSEASLESESILD